MIDNRTPNLDLPLPNINNLMKSEDVPRLRDALAMLDQAVSDRPTLQDVEAAIMAVVGNATPAALDTLKEIAAAINNDQNFAATITAQLATKLSAVPVATSVALGGVKVGAGLVVGPDGTLSTTGAGIGSGLPAFAETTLTPSSNGQTVFTPSGGYVSGQIELYLNGVLLYGGGDDYTANDGADITLMVGANTVDKLLLRKWYYIPLETAVNKTGDTMTGHLNVPSNASGTQVPRAQEVVRKAGDTMAGHLNVPAGAAGTQAPQVQEVVTKSGDSATTGKVSLQGSATKLACVLTNAAEKITIADIATSGTVHLDVTAQSQLYYTLAATANWTLNVRGNVSNSLNSLLAVGESVTVSFWATQGATAYIPAAFQVDGAPVTPKWQGSTAPVSGTSSGLDIYTLTIAKTANSAFTVLASQAPFK